MYSAFEKGFLFIFKFSPPHMRGGIFSMRLFFVLLLLLAGNTAFAQKVVRYNLYVKDTTVNITGKPRTALAVNGQIPMPTLTFTEGDTAEIWVHNGTREGTALHWHGVMLPNPQDGVAWLTQMPIPPGDTMLYRFPVIQHGTHWYHSHKGLQEQLGLYGSLVLNKKPEDIARRQDVDGLPTLPLVLSEWSDVKPTTIHRMLRTGNDWFSIKKNVVQSYGEAVQQGAVGVKLKNEWKRMTAMDLSDVYYDQVWINGRPKTTLSQVEGQKLKAGDQVRLRISNGGSSSYFWLRWAGGRLKVVASDGNDVEPVEVDRLIIAISETYDVVLTIPEDGKAYEFSATTEDRTKSASLFLGSGVEVALPPMPRLAYFKGMKMMNAMMDMRGNIKPMGDMMGLNKIDMNSVMYPEITGSTAHSNATSAGKMDGHMGHDMGKMEMDSASSKSEMHMGHDMSKMGKDTPASKPEKHKGHDMGHMKMGGHKMGAMGGHDMAGMSAKAMNDPDLKGMMAVTNTLSDIKTLNYSLMRSTENTGLPADSNVRTLVFELNGNMDRYVWSMNNKLIAEADVIPIKMGERLRIVLYNNSMMRHPMHLHGHDFRLYNGQGEHSIMKNVIDIMPAERDTFEFVGNAPGDWFFHCHLLYHMMSGMGRVVHYENQEPNPRIPHPKKARRLFLKENNMSYLMAASAFETNSIDGEVALLTSRWTASTEWRIGYNNKNGYETETHIGRHIGKMQWLMPFVGFDWRYRKLEEGEVEKNMFGQKSTKDNRRQFSVGVQYTLPMLLSLQTEVYHDGNVRVQLSREDVPLTRRLRMSIMGNTDKEYMLGFRYITGRHTAVSAHYDSDMGAGIGVTLNY